MITGLIIGGIVGFVIGALVFRNNAKQGEKIIDKLKKTESK
jgi:hypothetical protein